MRKYSKIQSIYKRVVEKGPDRGKFIDGEWSKLEFELLRDMPWEATEKIDGTNIRVGWDGETVEFGGRTDRAQIPADLVNHLRAIFTFEKFMDLRLSPGVVLFGEGYGNKIQAAGKLYKPEGVDFAMFDIWGGHSWWSRDAVEGIAGQFGVDPVRWFDDMTIPEAIEMVKGGFPSRIGAAMAEGLVLRAPLGLCDHGGHRLITKIKVRDFERGMVAS